MGVKEETSSGILDILENLSEKEFIEQIIQICRENPDVHNPTLEGGGCLYKRHDVKSMLYESTSAGHCIIGMWLLKHGGLSVDDLPNYLISAELLFPEIGFNGLAQIARLVQDIADTPELYQVRPPLWKTLTHKYQKVFEAELERVE